MPVTHPEDLPKTLVPYIALFDDCYGGVDQTMTADIRPLVPRTDLLESGLKDLFSGQMSALESLGVAIYAAKPGSNIGDFADPDIGTDAEGTHVGLLARRLLRVLRRLAPRAGTTVRDIRDAIMGPDVQKLTDGEMRTPDPFMISATDKPVLAMRLLPARKPGTGGELQKRLGSAPATQVLCCGFDR